MKAQLFLTTVALAAMTACSSNANKNASTTQQEAESSANQVENAIKLWSENESIKSMQETMDTTYAPNQMAYYDIDGDGTAELFLREYIDHQLTGFIAAYSLKNGVKEIALSNNSWQTTWLCVYNNGVVRTDEGSEGGMDGTTTYYKLKNSDLEKIYIHYTSEDE